jgi:hypothetical protein
MIQCAVYAVTSGAMTIAVENGTYAAPSPSPSGLSYVAVLSHSGASPGPIVIQAQNNLGATLDGGDQAFAAFDFDASVSNITIQGFVIQDFTGEGISANGGSGGASQANNNVSILWNHITANADDGVLVGDASTGLVIEYNEIDHTGTCSPGTANQYHGLYLEANQGLVANNVFHDNDCGYDIQYANETYDTNPSYQEYNNTFGTRVAYSGDPGNIVLYTGTGTSTPSLVSENDIFLANSTNTPPISCYPTTIVGSPTITIEYDLLTAANTATTNCSSTTKNANNLTDTAADFVGGSSPSNAAGYQLESNSPALGAGLYLSGLVPLDFYGDTRHDPPSIGAFENY